VSPFPHNARAGLNHPYEARKELRGYCEVSALANSAHRHADRPDIGRARVPKIPGAPEGVKTGVDLCSNARRAGLVPGCVTPWRDDHGGLYHPWWRAVWAWGCWPPAPGCQPLTRDRHSRLPGGGLSTAVSLVHRHAAAWSDCRCPSLRWRLGGRRPPGGWSGRARPASRTRRVPTEAWSGKTGAPQPEATRRKPSRTRPTGHSRNVPTEAPPDKTGKPQPERADEAWPGQTGERQPEAARREVGLGETGGPQPEAPGGSAARRDWQDPAARCQRKRCTVPTEARSGTPASRSRKVPTEARPDKTGEPTAGTCQRKRGRANRRVAAGSRPADARPGKTGKPQSDGAQRKAPPGRP
jgi:hypothetical protein